MAEVYTAFHTRRDVTVTLKSGDSPVKSYALKLHSGESITVGGPVTEPVHGRDQNGASYSARPGPVTENAMLSVGKVRIWDLGDNTTEAVSGDIVSIEGSSGGNPAGGYIASDWDDITNDPASAGYQTFTIEVSIVDFGSQKGTLISGVGFVRKTPRMVIEDEGTFWDGIEFDVPSGWTKTRNS